MAKPELRAGATTRDLRLRVGVSEDEAKTMDRRINWVMTAFVLEALVGLAALAVRAMTSDPVVDGLASGAAVVTGAVFAWTLLAGGLALTGTRGKGR